MAAFTRVNTVLVDTGQPLAVNPPALPFPQGLPRVRGRARPWARRGHRHLDPAPGWRERGLVDRNGLELTIKMF